MCSWCNKETVGQPQVSGYFLAMVCEHCGTKLEKEINYENFEGWIKNYYEKYLAKR